MYHELLCILLFTIRLVLATNLCVTQTPCKCVFDSGEVIDLTTVGSQDFPRFFELAASDVSHLGRYSYNPCYPFSLSSKHVSLKDGNKACVDAAGCKRSPGSSDGTLPEEHVIGLQNTATFGTSSELGIHINYTVPDANQNLTVILTCDNVTSDHLIVQTPETLNNSNIVMNLTSKCACKNGCLADPSSSAPSGLSTGSQLLIAFFTIVIAYLLFGILWKFCNGAQGMELIPNVEFWNDFPKLVVEGVIFSCSCFGRQSSYGEV